MLQYPTPLSQSCCSTEKREPTTQRYKEKHTNDTNYCLPLPISKLKNKKSSYNKDSDSFETC